MSANSDSIDAPSDAAAQPRANILLVDDEPANLLALRSLLDGFGQNLVEAYSGEEAVRRMQSEQFAVVLLDVRLPGIDGFETARRIRGLLRSRNTPLIFLTGYDIDRSEIERGYELGAVDFLVKPIASAVLRAKVSGLLQLYHEKERAKREADMLRLLVHATTDYAIFMLDPDGRVASWNTGAERLKGYQAKEIIGQHFSRFYPREAVERGWPEHELRVARAEGRFEDEGWRVRKDGTQFWANVVITALRDESGRFRGFSKITRDLTERKRLEENARRLAVEAAARRLAEENARLIQDERERLQVTLSSIGDAVISTDAQSRVTFLNPVAESLTGWKADEAAGRNLEDVFRIFNEATGKQVENPTVRALRDGAIVGLANHTVLVSKDGAERPIDDSAAPIRSADDDVMGSVLVFRDVTKQRRSDQHRNARLAMTQVLNQATTAKEAVSGILRTVCDGLAWDVGFLWMVNEERTALVCRQSWHRTGMPETDFETETRGRQFTKGEGLPGRVWEQGKPAWVFEILQDENFPRRSSAVEHGLHSVIGCPIVVGEQTLGVIEFFSSRTREADSDLLELMATIAGSLGLFIERKMTEGALRQREAALRRSEERFRQLANSMPQIVWTARPGGSIDFLNRRWTEFTGLPDTVGNDGWKTIVHPDDAGPAAERWQASLKSGSPFELEVRLFDRARQGYRWHLVRTVAVHDEAGHVARWFGTSTDIQEQKRAEESSRYLAAASAALAGVVDYESTLQKIANLAVPYFADWAAVDVADNGGLRRLAVAHEEQTKIELAHELARHYPPDLQAAGGIGAVFRTGKPEITGEIRDEMLVAGAKDERHLRLIRALGLKSFICVPLVVSGSPLGVLTFATAESGRRYTDADLALAMDLANRAAIAIENTRLYDALRETDRRKDEFLATLAHELRNPLAPIRNSLQILKTPDVDAPTVERSLEMMERQVEQLVRLVDDLMDVSRVMRGRIELRRERIELSAVVARAIETVQPLIDAHRQRLTLQVSDDSLPIEVDQLRMAQVVGNLLTNAAKYTELGGRIDVNATRDKDAAVLRIRDNGIGIDPKMLPRIFELFVQVDQATTRSQGGLGIGLTLVKNLVEMHNGTVEAHSEGVGKGSEFVVRLPLVAKQRAPTAGGESGRQTPEAPSPSGFRLLVVDDNRDAANSLALLLKLQGHEVRVAYSGIAALETARTYRPDMVFLDIGMPDMDGYEVARRLRQEPGLEKIVLAALTGWGQQEDRRRAAEAGFNHHLVKPPEPKTLEAVLAELKSTLPR